MKLLPVIFLLLFASIVDAGIPQRAHQYQRDLIRNARAVWGIEAPIATFAAQIHQESAWRPDVSSKYAHGLAQFTPATSEWISGVYRKELGANAPFNPLWALRALVRYDWHLYRVIKAATSCDRWAMTLASYNGGLGWVRRDKKLAARKGKDPLRWWNNVERYSPRAKWAFKENRDYPRRILQRHQALYLGWGPGVC